MNASGILRKRHADRIWAHARDVTLSIHCETIPFGDRLEYPIHGLQKIVAVRLNLQAHEVGAQQSIDKLALPRTNADRKSTRLNSSHLVISYAVFCLKKKI